MQATKRTVTITKIKNLENCVEVTVVFVVGSLKREKTFKVSKYLSQKEFFVACNDVANKIEKEENFQKYVNSSYRKEIEI